MRRNFTVIAVLVLMAFMLVLGAGTNEAADKYRSCILIEAETGTVLCDENGGEKMNVGYLSKLMSVLLIAEDIETGKYSLDDELTASDSVTGTNGSVVWLESGDSMTVDELLKSVIVGNANDALTVLAERSEQTVEKFVMRMNSEAFDLDLKDTAFYSPYGYYDEREHTTAHDIAVICARLAKYEFLKPYFATWRDFVRSGKAELVNENKLSRTYEPHIGFKVIHSDISGYCIAEGGDNGKGMRCIAVVLGAENEDIMYETAKSLLKKGYTGYKVTSTMFPEEMMRPLRIRNGEAPAAELMIGAQNRLAIPKGTGDLDTVVVVPEYSEAPVRRGQQVGTAAFYNKDSLIYETPLIVKSDVKRLSFEFVFSRLLYKMCGK
ncbi:MAG: D-alanyl-D-alanine carboxypeptidase [Ruminococcus sp.]|nr:D-alanyl-D-alanine carboxypeptidase [Ruminococcus sp.]